MSSKETTLKEKFRIALTSTAKVISDDFEIDNKLSDKKKTKELNTIEIEDLNNPSDFIKLRAETDSAALKKNSQMMKFIEKIYHQIILQDLYTILLKKLDTKHWVVKCLRVLKKIFMKIMLK
jgi:hypothetical protein